MLPTFNYLNDVHIGAGIRARLPYLLEQLGIRRPLIVTDEHLVALGTVDELALDFCCVFDKVATNPTEAQAIAGLVQYRQDACDGIIALGGGSPIDLAKIVGLLSCHPGPLDQYAIISGGSPRIVNTPPALIAIPTTAGSGSEVGRAALITLGSGRKLGFLSPHLLPQHVICDPELTVKMPPALTAGSGLDAISHCVETFCSARYNPVADAIALDGLKRGVEALPRAWEQGDDLQAREAMMLASLEGGLAFQKGLGAVHSLSHPLGSLTEKQLHHGTLNAIFLPIVLEYNLDGCVGKMDTLASTLELPRRTAVPDFFREFNHRLGLPDNLTDLGLIEDDVIPLASCAYADHCTATNPRRLEIQDFEKLYQLALS